MSLQHGEAQESGEESQLCIAAMVGHRSSLSRGEIVLQCSPGRQPTTISMCMEVESATVRSGNSTQAEWAHVVLTMSELVATPHSRSSVADAGRTAAEPVRTSSSTNLSCVTLIARGQRRIAYTIPC